MVGRKGGNEGRAEMGEGAKRWVGKEKRSMKCEEERRGERGSHVHV